MSYVIANTHNSLHTKTHSETYSNHLQHPVTFLDTVLIFTIPTLVFAGIFIDEMNDYSAGFLMAGVALIVSAFFLLLLHQINKKEKHKENDIPSENESEDVEKCNSEFRSKRSC